MDCKKAEAQLRNRCDPKNKWSKKGSPRNKKHTKLHNNILKKTITNLL